MDREHGQAPDGALQEPSAAPSVWCVVTWADGVHERRRYTEDHALAEAYAAAHHGIIVPLTAGRPWPLRPSVR